jgi:hypothetical protein
MEAYSVAVEAKMKRLSWLAVGEGSSVTRRAVHSLGRLSHERT